MYSIYHETSEVIRDSDGVVVSPAQSTDDPAFIEYIEWVEQGNEPTVATKAIQQKVLSVTPRQLRLALTQIGIRSQVEAAVAAADQDTKDTWEFSTECLRDNPLLNMMGASLGKSQDDLDALFALAATL